MLRKNAGQGLPSADSHVGGPVTALPVRNNRKTFFPNEPWFLCYGSRMEPVMAIFVMVHGAAQSSGRSAPCSGGRSATDRNYAAQANAEHKMPHRVTRVCADAAAPLAPYCRATTSMAQRSWPIRLGIAIR
jgi:hypothetical protein